MLVTQTDIEQMEVTLGQRRLLEKAIQTLQGSSSKPKTTQVQPKTEKITTSTLTKDSGLNALLQQLETDGQLDLLVNGAELMNETKSNTGQQHSSATSSRIDTDAQVFLGPAKPKKGMVASTTDT